MESLVEWVAHGSPHKGPARAPKLHIRVFTGRPGLLEHYASCRHVHQEVGTTLGLQRGADPASRLAAFLGLDWTPAQGVDRAIKTATRLAAIYRVRCHCCHGKVRLGATAREALGQASREVVRGSRKATAVYDAAVGWH